MGLRATLRADLRANQADPRSQFVLVAFRVCQTLSASRSPMARAVAVPARLLYRVVVIWIFGIDLPVTVQAGPGLALLHATGMVVHAHTVLGAGCTIKHGCTLGVRTGADRPATNRPPTLGDRVDLGPGCAVLGPVHLGDGAIVGANAVVLVDVPAGAVAVGNPARILPPRTAAAPAAPGPV